MAYRKNYSNSEYEKFLKQDFSSNFGISKEKLANAYTTSAVAKRYGLSKAWIKGTMIPYLENQLGGYATFMLKSMVEGGGACNYLNHYSPGGQAGCSNDKMQALKIDVGMVKATLKKHTPGPNGSDTGQPGKPAMSSYESNYITWNEDNPGQARKMWNAMPKGSIGAHYMQATHAGNGWIFQHSSAMTYWRGQWYDVGNAYDQMIAQIKYYGGDPFNGKKASDKGGKDTPSSDDSISGILKDLGREGQKVLEALFNEIEKMLTYDLHSIGTDMFFSNEYFKLFKTYNNTYRIQINIPFFDTLEKKVGSLDFGSNGSKGSKGKDDKDDKDDSKPSSNKTMEKIYQYLKKNVGNKFDEDGAYGAQCVDLVHHVSNHFGLGLNTAGDYAKNIASNPVPSGWKHVNVPNGASKAQRTKIWNDLPRGAVVYFWNAGAGHVGFKSGDNFKLLSQNMKNDALMGGGNITNENVNNFESGNHFFKAWVKE